MISRSGSGVTSATADPAIRRLFLLSETRGKESSGIAVNNPQEGMIHVLKSNVPGSQLIRSQKYRTFMAKALPKGRTDQGFALIAHSRLVTNGTQENNANNQPCFRDDVVVVHNGIVTNAEGLWREFADRLERKFDVDTEIIPALYRMFAGDGASPIEAVRMIFEKIKGAATIALLCGTRDQLILATNTGSLYTIMDGSGTVVFGSEAYIMQQFRESKEVRAQFAGKPVEWVKPFTGMIMPMTDSVVERFDLVGTEVGIIRPAHGSYPIIDHSTPIKVKEPIIQTGKVNALDKLILFPEAEMRSILRCTRCVLPHTFPFIDLDDQGVCVYCRNYVSRGLTVDRRPQLHKVLDHYRRNDGKQDCIVAFSGGRDSSYGLHLLVKEFGMTPLTFTYDWGLVTDLARRNIARMTGKLGVENILISADLKKKRRNVRLNMEAWLKRPELGMIPLFMAGDKHFFTYVNEIRERTGIPCDIWMENKLENTDFKVGFAGIPPVFNKERIDHQSPLAKLRMPLYYLKNFALQPGYLNRSIPDTISAFKAYYFEPREVYLLLFDYVPWNEQALERTLIDEYEWEVSPDTTSTWRIGDGTAAFYNYVYGLVAGFTEFDTFRSNQIREGMITREAGLEMVLRENRPRDQSMRWYFETIGVDMERALQIVNKMPRLYR